MAVDAPAANQDDAKTISREESQDGGGGGGDYSTTNVQVEGVDEADIIKNDGEYIYYYNQRQHEVAIIKSPVEGTTIDVDNAKVIKTINIPESFNALQMYVTNDRLIMLSQRWTNAVSQGYIDRSARMDVIVYDISDINDPALIKFSDMDGSYTDSRMIGDKLYVVSQLNVNWGFPWYMGLPMDKVMINADDMLPKTIDIAYTQDKADQNLTIGDTKFPYEISVQKPNCNEIFYVLPSKESVQKFGITPSFSVVRVIDTDAVATSVKTKTAFGSTQTIHMSQDNLYLADPLYTSYAFSCPINARCMLPRYGGGEHTLIHKFALTAGDVDYKASTIVQGSPLSQYSMSEDDAGNFRILTTNRSPEVTTHFFVLNETLDLEGMLMNIEPGEQFKSSRYIGDKLYLVTFEQIDPLFVVDIATPKTPKIIGELKIPGYSTYLHPYAPLELGVQYLIGIGYDTTTNQWGGTQNGGIKVDLYKVDYNKKDAKGQVLV